MLSLLLCVFAVLPTTRGVCTWTSQRVARIHDWCQTLTLTFHERKTTNQDNQTNQCYANNEKIHSKKDANFPAHARQIRVLFFCKLLIILWSTRYWQNIIPATVIVSRSHKTEWITLNTSHCGIGVSPNHRNLFPVQKTQVEKETFKRELCGAVAVGVQG